MMKKERIMVVEAKAVQNEIGIYSNGMMSVDEDAFKRFVQSNHSFKWRDAVENDPNYRQIISYCMIRCADSVLVTRRTNKQTESRLHNMFSVGIGGHISLCDDGGGDAIEVGMLRELTEEVRLNSAYTIQFDGLINDDSSAVNKVHTAVCYTITLEEPNCSINENDKMTGEWVRISDLKDYIGNMETWSAFYLKFKELI